MVHYVFRNVGLIALFKSAVFKISRLDKAYQTLYFCKSAYLYFIQYIQSSQTFLRRCIASLFSPVLSLQTHTEVLCGKMILFS